MLWIGLIFRDALYNLFFALKYFETKLVQFYIPFLEKIKESPCPPGWVRSKHGGIACYRLIQSKKTWSDAEKYCQRYGAKLLSISEK